jgi:phosphoglycerol geranylgeranyltransferase
VFLDIMNIINSIIQGTNKKRLHFSLLDPDKQNPVDAGLIARIAQDAGTSAIMVGGSTLLTQNQVDETVISIKKNTNLPVILFPSGSRFLSKYADAVFFMSLLNSRNLDFVIREHIKGANFIKKNNIEPISMGYVIVEPGMTAGKIGECDLLKRDDINSAIGYALATQYLGMKLFYLEAGSGAPTPIPNDMISTVKKNINIPLIVGGGIIDSNIAAEKVRAGADIIVTGTKLEQKENLKNSLDEIIKAIQE